jgi:hypothetical protein
MASKALIRRLERLRSLLDELRPQLEPILDDGADGAGQDALNTMTEAVGTRLDQLHPASDLAEED